MKQLNKWVLPAVLLLCLLLVSGCAMKSPSELYRLPAQPDSYYDLQAALDTIITGSAVYSAPVSGENRQAIQMQDLDGDGRNEAIVFAKGEGERPLKVFILSRDQSDSFRLTATIEGEGASYDRVSYAQVDGSPGLELLVGRTVSDQVLHSIGVYSLQNSLTVELVNATYTAYTITDLNADGREDLLLLRSGADSLTNTVELYHYKDGAFLREPELALMGTGSLKRMITGYSAENLSAVFIASQTESGIVTTDVFIMQDEQFRNLAAATDTDNMTVRSYPAYAADIDGDGLIELPSVKKLSSEDETGYQLITWYNLTAAGNKRTKLITYHDYSLGCYLVVPNTLKSSLIISSASTGHGTAYTWSTKAEGELFTVYAFTGNDRQQLSAENGRFLLGEKNGICFAASLKEGAEKWNITEDSLKNSFHLIRTDWNTGEM